MKRMIRTIAAFALATTGAWADNIVVYDDEPAVKDIVVASGQELEVRGNGLTANCTVTLQDTATLKVYKSATIAAPITITYSSTDRTKTYIRNDDQSLVESVFTGKLTVNGRSNTSRVEIWAYGRMTFSGGCDFGKGEFLIQDGNCDVTTNPINATAQYGCLMSRGGHLTFKDGGGFIAKAAYCDVKMIDTESSPCTAIVEIGKDGLVNLEGYSNCTLQLGNSTGSKTSGNTWTYLVNGGVHRHRRDGVSLSDGGVLELRSGTFSLGTKITAKGRADAVHKPKLILGGCTYKIWSQVYAFGDVANGMIGGTGCLDVDVMDDFVLDFSSLPEEEVWLVGSSATVDWNWTEGKQVEIKSNTSGARQLHVNAPLSSGTVVKFTGGKTTNLHLYDSASTVQFGRVFDANTSKIISESNSAAVVDAVIPGAMSVDHSWAAKYFSGFSGVTVGDVVVDPGDGQEVYLDSRYAGMADSITLKSGVLVLDTADFDAQVTVEGGSIRHLDAADNVLRNTGAPGTGAVWLNPSDETVAWRANAIAYLDLGKFFKGSFTATMDAYKVVMDSSVDSYSEGKTGCFRIGAGGLEFKQPNKWSLPSTSAAGDDRLVLLSDQTWRSTAENGVSRLTMGYGWERQKSSARIKAVDGVTEWKMSGPLEVWLYAPDNGLSNVAVTVESPAMIRMIANRPAKLNAKELVLDGSTMEFGFTCPTDDNYTYQTPLPVQSSQIGPDYLAPTVTLKNGAKLFSDGSAVVGGGIVIRASGSESVSLKGVFELTDDKTVFDVPAGSTLDLSKAKFVGSGSYKVTGEGKVIERGGLMLIFR